MKLSALQEKLARLYLRLNGYFLSGQVVHASMHIATELDVLGVRFPFHRQPEREILSSEYLQIPADKVDVIIGEVKGRSAAVQFNAALRENKTESVEKLVNWFGMFDANDAIEVSRDLVALLKTSNTNSPENFKQLIKNEFSIRPILFAIDRPAPTKNHVKYVHGQEILDYIWKCLRPDESRIDCSVTYNYEAWGEEFADLVKYFKGKTGGVGTAGDLYEYFSVSHDKE